MAKPSASELQKAAEAVDLDGFDYEVTIETVSYTHLTLPTILLV